MKDKDIHRAIAILKDEVQQWKTPIVGEIENRYRDPYRVLISCLLSLRTKDKVTEDASLRLFSLAGDPRSMLKLTNKQIEKVIFPVGFYRRKAETIRRVSNLILKQYDGAVPDTIDELLKLPGVGRKTANLVVTVAYKKPGICVDTHVHRIFNRWGYVETRTPFETEMALRAKLPREYWIIINELIVSYGQHRCTPRSPRCEECALSNRCDYYAKKTIRKQEKKP
jgi:endonuclease-3